MSTNEARDPKGPIRARSRDQFRLDLVEAARRLFLENGVLATSMADLGRELGVSKPTVYEAFESKQALIDAVFLSAAQDVELSWLMGALQAPPPFSVFLERSAESYKNFMRSPRSIEAFQLVIREGMHSNDMLAGFETHLAGPSRVVSRKLVAIAIERGECLELPIEVVHRMLVAPLYYLMVDRAMYGANALPLEAAVSYIDHSFAALKTHLCGIKTPSVLDAKIVHDAVGKIEAA